MHTSILTFTGQFLCTSTLLLTSWNGNQGWRIMGQGWFYCPQLNWESCGGVYYETSSVLLRIFFCNDSTECKNFMGLTRVWAGALVWMGMFTWLQQSTTSGGGFCAASWGVKIMPLINKLDTKLSYALQFHKAAASEGSAGLLLGY